MMGVMHWCAEHEWVGEDEMRDRQTCFCGRAVNVVPPRVPFSEAKERPVESARWFHDLMRSIR